MEATKPEDMNRNKKPVLDLKTLLTVASVSDCLTGQEKVMLEMFSVGLSVCGDFTNFKIVKEIADDCQSATDIINNKCAVLNGIYRPIDSEIIARWILFRFWKGKATLFEDGSPEVFESFLKAKSMDIWNKQISVLALRQIRSSSCASFSSVEESALANGQSVEDEIAGYIRQRHSSAVTLRFLKSYHYQVVDDILDKRPSLNRQDMTSDQLLDQMMSLTIVPDEFLQTETVATTKKEPVAKAKKTKKEPVAKAKKTKKEAVAKAKKTKKTMLNTQPTDLSSQNEPTKMLADLAKIGAGLTTDKQMDDFKLVIEEDFAKLEKLIVVGKL
jgi:hypothetical protein